MHALAPIILIVASVGLFLGYTNPAYTKATGNTDLAQNSVKELQSKEKDYVDALSKTREIELAREGLAAKFSALDPVDQERVLKLLPDHIDSVRLIIDVNNIAARYGMSISNITLSASESVSGASKNSQATAPSGPGSAPLGPSGQVQTGISGIGPDSSLYDSVKLGFSVSGSYENFLQFAKELEESLRVVEITALSFGGSSSESSAGYTYKFTIRTYYLK